MDKFQIKDVVVEVFSYCIEFTKKVKGLKEPLSWTVGEYGNKGSEILQQEVEGKSFQLALHRRLSGRHISQTYKNLKAKGLAYVDMDKKRKDKEVRNLQQRWIESPLSFIYEWVRNNTSWKGNTAMCNILPNNEEIIKGDFAERGRGIQDNWTDIIARLNGLEIATRNEYLIAKIIEIETYRQSQANPFLKISFSIA